jgi:lipopolysaccharide export LptBFGC system permease protein LptF
VVGYYLLMTAATSFAETRRLPYIVAAWLPNLLLLLLTIGLLAWAFPPRFLVPYLLPPRSTPPAASS